jgi:hypothetical protein
MTVEKTGVITYYAVHRGGVAYTVADTYDANADYTERTILELEKQEEPTREVQNRISDAIGDFENHS